MDLGKVMRIGEDFKSKLNWRIFKSVQFEISLVSSSQEEEYCFEGDFLQVPEWDKLMTIHETSEFIQGNQNSKDTLARNMRQLTPLLVQSEYEPVERKYTEESLQVRRVVRKEGQRNRSDILQVKENP